LRALGALRAVLDAARFFLGLDSSLTALMEGAVIAIIRSQ